MGSPQFNILKTSESCHYLFMSGFVRGFKAPFRAIPFIFKAPSVLALVAVPLLINLVLYVALFWFAADAIKIVITTAVTSLSAHLPAWLVVVADWGMTITAWFTLLIVSAFTFTFVAGLLAAPFNDLLSRRTTKIFAARRQSAGAQALAATTPLSLSFVTSMRMEFKRTIILLLGGGFAALMGIIPFFQLPAITLGAFVLTFEYVGYAIAQRSSSLWTVWAFVLKNPARTMCFGCALLLLMALPFVGIVYVPLAVVGATLLHDKLV